MERTSVIVAFGDVTGFNPWIRRGANAPEVIQSFIQNFYEEMEVFVKAHKGVQIKYLGDGFMILKELKPTCIKGTCAATFIRDAMKLAHRLAAIVHRCEFPPPDGFRVRIAHGHVSKIHLLDPRDEDRKRKTWEFIGYAVNLAQKLLDVSPRTLFLIHESAVEILGRQKTHFRLRRFVGAKECPRGVDQEDIDGLWTVGGRFDRKKHS